MPKKTDRNWDLSLESALRFNMDNSTGSTWLEVYEKFCEETKQEVTTDAERLQAEITYFRQKVRKIVKQSPEGELEYEVATVAERLTNLYLDPYTYITPDLIHQALGVPKQYFELDGKITFNTWGRLTTTDFIRRLENGQIKVSFKVKPYIWDEEKFLEYCKTIKPVHVDPIKVLPIQDDGELLVLPFFDLHFGFMKLADYLPSRDRILRKVQERNRETIHIPIGQDVLHNNDDRGNTANGTPIEKVDTNQAIQDAIEFYDPIVRYALQYADNVEVIYSKGNHDESLALAVMYALRGMYPQATFDFTLDEYKNRVYGNVSLIYTHSDKLPKGTAHKRLHDLGMALFMDTFTMKHDRHVLTGHFHKAMMIDENGTWVWSLATRKGDDGWHIAKGFVGSKKVLHTFTFSRTEFTGMQIV